MEYVNKSGEAALRGIRLTGGLDDDGLPALSWYGAKVKTLTAALIIEKMLDALDFMALDGGQQSFIVSLMCDGAPTFQRHAIRRIVRRYRRAHSAR